jgi:hypothetical protein
MFVPVLAVVFCKIIQEKLINIDKFKSSYKEP